MNLTQYANKFGTDKGTVSQAAHSYSTIYDLLFSGRQSDALRILEIGLSTGGPELGNSPDRLVTDAPSIRMWHEFFPNAKIFGLDISDFSRMQTDWFSFIRADCGDEKQLERVAEFETSFDLIIDDGSHASFHQQLTLIKLFPFLRSGGLYCIEDLDWQPPHLERTLPFALSTTKQLQNFITNLSFLETEPLSLNKWNSVSSHIKNVMLIDDDELYSMRRMYNERHRLKAEHLHYYDKRYLLRLITRGFSRRLLENSAQFARAVTGRFGPLRRSRVKLALIHKC